MLDKFTKTDTASLTELVERLGVSQSGMVDSSRDLRMQIEVLTRGLESNSQASQENTAALQSGSRSNQAETAAKSIGQIAKTAAGSLGAIGFSPILSGLLKLFGGGGSNVVAQAPPVPYVLPRSLQLDAGLFEQGARLATTDTSQTGLPRSVGSVVKNTETQTVNVQIHALDAKSILDRSDDIANALREAVLNSHGVNDVLGDL